MTSINDLRPAWERTADCVGVTLTVIIPVFNEAATISRVIHGVAAIDGNVDIIVVDDGSSDDLPLILSECPTCVRYLRHERNLGKGAAIRTGLTMASGTVVVIQDADLEYDPGQIAQLVAPILSGEADVCYGSRFRSHSHTSMGWTFRLANQFLTWLSNLTTGLRLTDVETCYKACRRDALMGIRLRENGFGIEPEITAKLARRKLRFMEVPVSYRARSYSAGKKIGFKDGLRAIWCIFRYAWRD